MGGKCEASQLSVTLKDIVFCFRGNRRNFGVIQIVIRVFSDFFLVPVKKKVKLEMRDRFHSIIWHEYLCTGNRNCRMIALQTRQKEESQVSTDVSEKHFVFTFIVSEITLIYNNLCVDNQQKKMISVGVFVWNDLQQQLIFSQVDIFFVCSLAKCVLSFYVGI